MATYTGTSVTTTPGVQSSTSGTDTANAIVATQSNASGGNSAVAATNNAGGNNLGSAVWATCNTTQGYGVKGINSASGGYAIFGNATGGGSSYGVLGEGAVGVWGSGIGSGNAGVWGYNIGSGGWGVYGEGYTYGVYGYTTNGVYGVYSQGAAYVLGNLTVSGSITAGTKDFKIDHPLDPANKYLSHGCVESPDRKNVYDGVIEADKKGEAVVTMPAYFDALNGDFRYQLTALGGPAPDLHIKSELSGGKLVIAGAKPKQRVSWQVTGIRRDAYSRKNPLVVEEEKPAKHKGLYLHPEAHGQPAEKHVEHETTEQRRKKSESAAKDLESRRQAKP
jgi:hypothetical protein